MVANYGHGQRRIIAAVTAQLERLAFAAPTLAAPLLRAAGFACVLAAETAAGSDATVCEVSTSAFHSAAR